LTEYRIRLFRRFIVSEGDTGFRHPPKGIGFTELCPRYPADRVATGSFADQGSLQTRRGSLESNGSSVMDSLALSGL